MANPPDKQSTFAATPYKMPTQAYVRPCERIMEESSDSLPGLPSIAKQYHGLTMELPLAGGHAMREIGGELDIIRYLRSRSPWLEPAISVLDRQLRLQLWSGRPWISFRPMFLVGPPGSGKSHLAALLAGQIGCGHSVLDFAGISDSRTIEGTARGYTTSHPCFPAIVMHQHQTANPVLIVEEVDKAGGSKRNGDPLAVLLTMAERSTARTYFDKCLMAPIDLSHVNWVLTANSIENLPRPLLSRLDIIHVEGPAPLHFDGLLTGILQDIRTHWQLSEESMPELHVCAEAELKARFIRHRSARQLGREVEAALSAIVPLLSRRVN